MLVAASLLHTSSPTFTRSEILRAARFAAFVPLRVSADVSQQDPAIPVGSDLFRAIMEPSASDVRPKDHAAPVARPKPRTQAVDAYAADPRSKPPAARPR